MSNIMDYNTSDLYEKIIGNLQDLVKEPLFPGDERRIFGEALVAVFAAAFAEMDDKAKQRMLKYARGIWLDAIGERVKTPRIASAPATTVLRYTRRAASVNVITIPAGTRATGDGIRYFATDADAVIEPDAQSVDIPASAVEGGAAYNDIAVGGINQQVDLIPHIQNVISTEITTGGNDGEPYTEDGDNAYRARIKLAPNQYSTAGPTEAYRYFAMSADAAIVDVKPTSPAPCEVYLAILLAEGAEKSDKLLEKVLDACNARDVRPMTDIVTAGWAEEVPYSIDITCYATSNAISGTMNAMTAAIDDYINWQGRTLGRDINPDQLRLRALGAGALRMDIREPVGMKIMETQIAVLAGDVNIEYRVVSE